MDLNDLWQQHKTWLLGILGGLIVFLVANTWISRRFDTTSLDTRIARGRAELRKSYYGSAQRKSAREDSKLLERERGAVGAMTFFTPRPAFDLAGKGDPTFHYIPTASQVKRDVRQAMDIANVQFGAPELGMPPNNPVEREEIQETLIALDLVDDALARLLEASRAVQLAQPDARGLAAVDQIRIEAVAAPRTAGYSRSKSPGVDLGTVVRVSMRFHCDPMTLQTYLESCAGSSKQRALLVHELMAKAGDEPGEPMEVRITHEAIVDREAANRDSAAEKGN
ncbi:MAG: hypothetical protein H6832_08880 [Planctomycetes bacterium]|nr:hypothetical protein [Planctomycetota bacterium]